MEPVPLELVPTTNRTAVEIEPFVALPRQIDITLLGRRVVVIEDDINEPYFLKLGIERHFIMSKSAGTFRNHTSRPVDDKSFGLLFPVNADSGASPHVDVNIFKVLQVRDFDWGLEIDTSD